MTPINSRNQYFEIPGDLSITQPRYFRVVAKCGHVGKGMYFKGRFYVAADSASHAAARTRRFPRVKHDYKDAIISVTEISYQDYLDGQNYEYNRPYYNCKSKQEQALYWDEISQDVYWEEEVGEVKSTKKHSLKKSFNQDPLYAELKRYKGNINLIEIA